MHACQHLCSWSRDKLVQVVFAQLVRVTFYERLTQKSVYAAANTQKRR